MFEKASRLKLRFSTMAGLLSIEDLWDLPLTSRGGTCLDDIAKDLSKTLSEQTESFVEKPAPKDKETALAFELVKRIIKVRLEENKANLDAKKRKEEKAKIMEIIGRKQDQALEDLDIEDLKKRLDDL